MKNGILKLIWFTITPLMLLFLIWFIVGYVQYGEEIFNKHLDVLETFKQLDKINFKGLTGQDGGNETLLDTIRSCREMILKFNQSGILTKLMTQNNTSVGLQILTGAIDSLINPVFGMAQALFVFGSVFVIVLHTVFIFTNVIISIGEFILSPVFI